MTVTVTGTTLTGCTIGPYFDPNILFGTANNQIGITYDPVISLAKSTNNTVTITYDPVISLAKNTNNTVTITYAEVVSLASNINNQVSISIKGA